jgi:hypothetical protein
MADMCHLFPPARRVSLLGSTTDNPVTRQPGDRQPGDRQDVPHEPVCKDLLNSARVVIIFLFLPAGASSLGLPRLPIVAAVKMRNINFS